MKKWKYLIGGLVVYLLAIFIISFVEKGAEGSNINSFTDALWYAIVTLTTVGYGDFFPVTTVGRMVGLLLIIGSIGVLGFVISEITVRFNNYMEKKKNGFWGTDFESHYLIIGWNEFSKQVAMQIFNTGHKVAFVINDKNHLELIKDLFPDDNCFCLFAEFTNMEAYEKVNISKCKGVFVNFEEDTDTLVFVLNMKKAYPDADIVVTCKNSALKATFKNAGINHVVAQSEVASRLVASYIFEPQVASYTEDLISTSESEHDFDIQQYRLTDKHKMTSKSFLDFFWEMKEKYNATVIGMVVDGKVIKNPDNKYEPKIGDYLMLISDGKSKRGLEVAFGCKEGE